MGPEHKRKLSGARGFIARFAVLTWIVWFCASVRSPFDDREFDPTIWRQYAGSSDWQSPRGRMHEDPRQRLIRAKPTREEVLRLLGPPDVLGPDGVFRYTLGAWSGFRMDYDTMMVTLDQSQHVSSVYREQG